MDADIARLLLAEGVDLLDDLPPFGPADELALGTRLRQDGHAPELVAAVLGQATLRRRAVAKFGPDAARMLFTPDGLEQATRSAVASRHASRFADAGITSVLDLGCGLGADAVALARAGVPVDALDADSATALLADHNITALAPGSGSRARCGRAEDVDLTDLPGVGVWLDPARRTPGRTDATGRTRRTFRLDDMSPTWPFVLDVAARAAATGAKLSPAFPHTETPSGAEAEWVSTDGALVECAVWFPSLARTPGRTATVLRDGSPAAHLTEADAVDAPPPGTRPLTVGAHLYEPDLAVLQAGLTGALALATDGAEIAAGMGYVVADRHIDLPYARRHTIAEVLPANPRAIKAWLKREGHTGLTIKRRGGQLDPDVLRKRLGLGTRGGDQATLLLTVGPDGPVAVVLV